MGAKADAKMKALDARATKDGIDTLTSGQRDIVRNYRSEQARVKARGATDHTAANELIKREDGSSKRSVVHQENAPFQEKKKGGAPGSTQRGVRGSAGID